MVHHGRMEPLRWRRTAAVSPRPRSAPRSCSRWPARPWPPPMTGPAPPCSPTRCRSLSPLAAVAVVGAVVTLAVPATGSAGCCWRPPPSWASAAFTEAGIHGVVTVPGSVPGAAYLAALGPGLQAAGTADRRGRRARRVPGRPPARAAVALAGLVRRRRGGLPVPRQRPEPAYSTRASWPAGTARSACRPVYGNVADALSAAGVLLAVAAAAGAVAGLVTRWRRGGPLVRQQLLFLALAACPPALVLLAILITNGVPAWIFGVVLAAAAGRDRGRDPRTTACMTFAAPPIGRCCG